MSANKDDFPRKIFVRSEGMEKERILLASSDQDAGGENGDLIGVYRLSHVRKLKVQKTLSLPR